MKNKLHLYFIAGTTDVGEKDIVKVLESALKGGITAFQLREKALVGEDLRRLAVDCLKLCNRYQVPFIMNCSVELALEIGADGIHADSVMDVTPATHLAMSEGKVKLLGITVSTKQEALLALDKGANYMTVGPLYESTSFPFNAVSVENDLLERIARELPGLPLVGEGGISERKASSVIRKGASGIAVTTAILDGVDIEATTRKVKGRIMLALTGVEM